MSETIINGIDVSEYFIDVVDEGGSTIDYKILPNSERLLAEKIFEQNQQLKRLQEENEKLKENQCCPETCEYIATEIIRYTNVCEVNSKYKQALEKIRDIVKPIKDNTCFGMSCGAVDWILNEIDEVLKDV